MEKKRFADLLKQSDLNRKEFAAKFEVEYQTVLGWGSKDRPFPYWVESWLDNYIKAKKYTDAKEIFCDKK